MNVGPSRPKLPNEIWSSSSEPYAVVRSASTLTWNVSVAGEVADAHLLARRRHDLDAVDVDVTGADVAAGGAQVEPVAGERERVVAVAGVDPDAVDLAGVERELLRR